MKLNKETKIDLAKLIDSRMLIQANSGGGKSWANRRIIEEAFGKVQIIVIDPEGEFANMREEYDFVYAGKGGDCPAETRSAVLLAQRLLELKASAIIDIYELPPQERKHFVKLFLDAMVNAPKELWHDCLVILDEAHVFAPEKDQAESLSAVIDMASRGRKRGFCLIPATQRPAKLSKDVAAECNNKLIGRASLDIDRKRSAEELGFNSKEEVLSLRNLEPGEFYAFGPAISKDVIKVVIGDVKVKPPKRGQRRSAPPPPSAHVKQILGKLSDIPQEAAKEAKTTAELKAEISELRRHKCPPVPVYDHEKMRQEIEKLVLKAKVEVERSFDDEMRRFKKQVSQIKDLLKKIGDIFPSLMKVVTDIEGGKVSNIPMPTFKLPASMTVKPQIEKKEVLNTPNEGISSPKQRILDAIRWFESIGNPVPDQAAVAFLAGYTVGGGGFNNPKGSLRTAGLIEYHSGSRIALTPAGRSMAKPPDEIPTTEELHSKVLGILPTPERRILEPLLEAYPESLTNEELATASNYTLGSGGFNNPKGRLRTLGLIEYVPAGSARAKSLLFL